MLPPKWRFYAFIFFCLLIVLSSFIGTLLWKPFGSFVFPLPLLVVVWVLRRMFIPVMSGQTRIRLASLALLYSTSVLYFFPSNPITAFLLGIFNQFLPKLGFKQIQEPLWYSLVAQLLVSIVIIALNIIWRSQEVTDTPTESSESLLSLANQDFSKSLERYRNALISALDRYDNDVNWSDRELTPLEAEVETEKNNRLRPKIVKDLVAAIKRDRDSSVFVVLGDPGSGKSVSLRSLVRILCQQAQNTGVVPVYVNLREYPSQRRVTTNLIWEFAKERAYEQTGRDGRNFLDTYYETLRINSRLFFVIDSFDELPSVLDSDDRSDSHKQISAEFDRFFTQEIQSCRAVLASRHFRAPVGLKGTRLILRPFRESQIRSAMETWLLGRGIDTERYIRRLFREKPQLVPLLRNPFTAELIAEYRINNPGAELPDNLFDVFDSYIFERLKRDQPKLNELNITIRQVRDGAALIAKSMYQSGIIGLEAEVGWVIFTLKEHFSDLQAESIIEALAYSRISRLGGRTTANRRFSFVHRRFAEFFVVEASKQVGHLGLNTVPFIWLLLRQYNCVAGILFLRKSLENFLDIQGIPTDSRWRDCLVMYCGVSELSTRKEIANYCWQVIANSKNDLLNGDFSQLRSFVHCLRFLTDAFRSDFKAIEDFRSELGDLVIETLKADDILIAKIGAEAIPLIEQSQQEKAIILAFESKVAWINRTTLNSCRNLSKLNSKVENSIRKYIRNLSYTEIIKNYRDIAFNLSLSEIFSRQSLFFKIDFIEIVLLFIILLIYLGISYMISPYFLMLNIMVCYLLSDSKIIKEIIYKHKIPFIIRRRSDNLGIFMLVIFTSTIIIVLAILLFYYELMPDNIYAYLTNNKTIQFFLFSILFYYVVFYYKWDIIISLLDLIKRPKKLLFIIKDSLVPWMPTILIASLLLLFMAIIIFLSEKITFLERILDIINYTMNLLVYVVYVPYILIIYQTTISTIKSTINFYKDKKRIKSYGIPQTIISQRVYSNCLEYKTSSMRQQYLEILRLRRVPLIGNIEEPPPELLKDKLVAEELGKLREQWYNLSS